MKDKNRKIERKVFFMYQNEQEEEYLERMSEEGWYLVSVNKNISQRTTYGNLVWWQGLFVYQDIPKRYEFVRRDPEKFRYQIDYVNLENDTEYYYKFVAELGWELVAKYPAASNGTWCYFRKAGHQEGDEQFFSDAQSKYELYTRIWQGLGVQCFICWLFGMSSSVSIIRRWMSGQMIPGMYLWAVFDVFLLIAAAIMTYAIRGLLTARKREKQKILQL